MGRPKLQPGSWGDFTKEDLGDGNVQLSARYRRTDGSSGRVRAQGRSKADAERKIRKKLATLVTRPDPRKPPAPPTSDPTFRDVATEWLAHDALRAQQREIAAATFAGHQRLARRILIPRLGSMLVKDISTPVIARTEPSRVLCRFYAGSGSLLRAA